MIESSRWRTPSDRELGLLSFVVYSALEVPLHLPHDGGSPDSEQLPMQRREVCMNQTNLLVCVEQ